MQKIRLALQRTIEKLPESAKQDPEIRAIADMARHRSCNIIHLIYQSKLSEGQSKDYEFGLNAMRVHWQSGLDDIHRTLADPRRLDRPAPESASSPMTSIAAIELSRNRGSTAMRIERTETKMRKRSDELRRSTADHCESRPPRVQETPRSRIGVDQLLMRGAVMRQHVDEGSDLSRQMMPMRVDRVHRKLNWPILGQEPHQPAGFKIVMHQEPWGQADATPLQRRTAQSLATVGNEISRHTHGRRHALAINEAPLVPKGVVDVSKAIVLTERGKLLHASVSLDVSLRAAKHVTPGRQTADDQTGVGRRCQPECDVKSFIDHVDAGFAHHEFDLDFGISRKEFANEAHERYDVSHAIDAQRSPWRRLQRRRNIIRFFEISKDLRGAVAIGFADLGEADLARGPVQKPDTETILERLDVIAHHRLRHVEPARCRREPPHSTTRTKAVRLLKRSIIRLLLSR